MKLLTLVLCAASLPLLAEDPSFTPQERANVIQLLKDSRKETIDAVKDLTDEQWKWKPAPDRWSVGEVAEHIVLAEGSLFGRLQAALDSPANPEWAKKTAGKTELILKVMAPRMGKAQAPEAIVPQGKLSRAEVMARFDEVRAKTLRFAEETKVALKEHTSEHPFPIFGTLNAYQWLIYIPLHNMRHDKQIEEVKATAGFPK